MSHAPLHFDTAPLSAWMNAQFGGGGEVSLAHIEGGQSNPTYFLSHASGEYVLRKQPPGTLLPSAHAIDREHRIMAALAETNVPVPKMRAYCDDRTVIGTPFYLMEKLIGRVFPGVALPELPPAERRAYVLEHARVLARLHTVDWAARGLTRFGKPGNYFARQVGRWTQQWQSSKLSENPDVDWLSAWLNAHVPEDSTTTIAHGDYRMGNVLWHPSKPQILGVLDWELATLGHPMADLAYSCMAWEVAPKVFFGVRGCDLAALQIPTQAEYVDAYFTARGDAPGAGLRPFHMAFSMFRFAVILEGVAARAHAGNAASAHGAEVGAQAAAFAARGRELAGG